MPRAPPSPAGPRPEPRPPREPAIPSACGRRARTPPSHRRQQAPVKVRVILLFLLVQTALETEPCSSRSSELQRCSSEPPPSPAECRRLPLAGHPSRPSRNRRPRLDQGYPRWPRSIMDQWTESTTRSTAMPAIRSRSDGPDQLVTPSQSHP
jgi:hypothetical protein